MTTDPLATLFAELKRQVREEILAELPDQAPEPWMTLDEAAKHAKASPDTLRRAIAAGELRCGRAGAAARVLLSDVDRWMLRDENPPAAPAHPKHEVERIARSLRGAA